MRTFQRGNIFGVLRVFLRRPREGGNDVTYVSIGRVDQAQRIHHARNKSALPYFLEFTRLAFRPFVDRFEFVATQPTQTAQP